ncbi:Cyclic di-GMP phosphodiesterase Gmr [Marinomonas spartinae]|nr:Cyclic di-GMP phosphodiesterase Gmr [Marinomonas spartinae]
MSEIFLKLLNRPKQACIFVFITTLLICGYVAFVFYKLEVQDEKDMAMALAKSHASTLMNTLSKSTSANYAFAAMIQKSQGDPDGFSYFADSLKPLYPDVTLFSLAPQGVIQYIYPLKKHEKALHKHLPISNEEKHHNISGQARRSVTFQGPVHLFSDKQEVVASFPIYLPNEQGRAAFWGLSITTIDLTDLIRRLDFQSVINRHLDYQLTSIALSPNAKEQTLSASQNIASSQHAIHLDIPVQGMMWRLYLAPEGAWIPAWVTWLGVLLVIFVSLLASCFVYWCLKNRLINHDLESLVNKRVGALKTSNKRLKTLLNAMPDSVYEVGVDGCIITYHSPRIDQDYHFLGSPLGMNYQDFFPASVKLAFEAAQHSAKKHGTTRGHECYLESEHERRWYEVSATYFQPDHEKDGFFDIVVSEVTFRKSVESELRIAATAFRTQDGILITDTQNRIVRVNSAFEKITGYTEKEVIGKTPAIISSGRHSKAFFRDMYEHIEKCEGWEGEIWNRRKDGEIFPEWLSISVVKDERGVLTHYVATFKDITETKDNERRINQLNYYDSLTRLANRRLITKDLDHILESGILTFRRSALLFVDIDHFKDVNDVKGHLVGDMLLQQVASRLMDSTRSGDIVSRFGGDEFLIMLEDVDVSVSEDRIAYRAKHVAEKIMKALSMPFELDGAPYNLSASIGIALFGKETSNSEEVIKQAELALYEAKGRGRNQVCFYAPQMHEKVLERVTLDSDFRRALAEEQFVLYYQPQWTANQEMKGVEALVRWRHPEKGMISPVYFIPFAEESKLILPLGDWVLRTALKQLADWQQDPALKHLIMSVNVSALQFSQEGFVSQVKEVIYQTGIPPAQLQIELTESMLVHDQFDIIQKMQSLKQLGVLISLDDFGTGYSSLSYLQQLPIDQLKIDQSFIRAIQESDKQASLAASIIGLGHNLHMEVIAEGVETQAQFDWLKQHECDLFQGFLLARPMSIDTFCY